MTFNHCTLSCLFFLTWTEHILVFNWTQRWSVPGSCLAVTRTCEGQGLYPRLLPSFFYASCSRSSSLAEIWPRYLNGPGYDNGLLSQTFYQLYMCYRDNSIVIRSSPSIIYRKKYSREHLEIRRTNVWVWRRWKPMAKNLLSSAQIFCQSPKVLCCLKANSTLTQFSSIRFYLIIFLRLRQERNFVK